MKYRHNNALAISLAAMLCINVTLPFTASANDDVASFATEGYARGLRTQAEMHKIDTNGDGMVSLAEWLAYQDKLWNLLDKDHRGTVDEKAFLAPKPDMPSIATGDFSRGLQTKDMMHKIDTDNDGSVSHEEFIAYQTKVFEMIDAKKTGNVGMYDFIGKH